MPKGICRSIVCGREVWRVGLCAPHYGRLKRGGDIDTPIRQKRTSDGVLERDEYNRKQCNSCKLWKPLDAFHKNRTKPDGLLYHCKDCDRQKTRLSKYGVSPERYSEMLIKQANKCAICGISGDEYGNAWSVDHDHSCCSGEKSCGKCVRGLLCVSCNVGIGNFKDSVQLLAKATNYLEEYNG